MEGNSAICSPVLSVDTSPIVGMMYEEKYDMILIQDVARPACSTAECFQFPCLFLILFYSQAGAIPRISIAFAARR